AGVKRGISCSWYERSRLLFQLWRPRVGTCIDNTAVMWRSHSLPFRSLHPPEVFMAAKVRRKRHTYSNAKRISILQAARDQGLTALDVKKRFGVSPVTYYSWRRKYGAGSPRTITLQAGGRARKLGI